MKLRADGCGHGVLRFGLVVAAVLGWAALSPVSAADEAEGAKPKSASGIAVELTVPDSAWTITIDEVYRVEDELRVVSTVSRDPDMMTAQVISTVRASLRLDAPGLPVKHFVIGKSWGWENREPYVFVDNRRQIEDKLKEGTLLYRRQQHERQKVFQV